MKFNRGMKLDRHRLRGELYKDATFRSHFRKGIVWAPGVSESERNGGLFVAKAVDLACTAVERGETNPKAIRQQVKLGLAGQIIIGIIARLIINAIVAFILKRAGHDVGDDDGEDSDDMEVVA
jgi:hypothetical protein